jgi:hypothetical protein
MEDFLNGYIFQVSVRIVIYSEGFGLLNKLLKCFIGTAMFPFNINWQKVIFIKGNHVRHASLTDSLG